MKVLHINTYDTGGAGIASSRIHCALLAEGVESEILFKNKTQNAQNAHEIWEKLSDILKVKKLAEQKLFDAKQKQLANKVKIVDELFSNFTSIWDITKSQLYIEADIIHLHWVAGFVDIASFFKQCNKPIVWTLHDFAPFNNGLHYPTPEEKVYEEDAIKNKAIIEEALKHASPIIVTPSNYLKTQSLNSETFKNLKHLHIPNPINSTTFYFKNKDLAKSELNLPKEKKILVFVADELSYTRKGFKYLLKTLNYLNSNNIHCIVIGNKQNIETKDNVQLEFTGHLKSNEKLCKIYNAADLLVVPSLNDNLPNIIVESLCCGTPVVAFNVGGIPEMIVDNENGFLSEEINSSSLAKNISKALNHSWNYKEIAQVALKKYSSATAAKKYIEVYKECL